MAGVDVSDAEVDAFVDAFEGPSAEAAASDAQSDVATVPAGQHRLRVRTLGEGAIPAVLVHGFGGDLDAWLFNHAALAGKRLVHALELPGHGQSSKDVGKGDLAMLVGALGAALDALEVEHAHLVGQSLGGLVVLAYAHEHPGRVASLALIASAGLGEEIDGEYLDAFVAASRRKEMKPALEKLFADPKLVKRQLVEDVLRHKRLDGAHDALVAIRDAVFPGGRQASVLADRIVELPIRPLVIWGARDQIIPRAHAEVLTDRCDVHVVEGAGHMVQMEAAGAVNRLLEAHLG
jgi:pyruvate dehydrogenase E2 component (dihydrolipoamide acetyltransferase)